eukprot:jgi/Ulvmu1/12751/UM095_0056.1
MDISHINPMLDHPVPVAAICSFWQEFDLDGRRNAMDEAAMRVAEFQEATVLKRKELSSSTRTFKAKASSDISKAVGPLLKAYQGEVDRLTRRSKHAESAFLDMYRELYEAPDPVLALAGALEAETKAAQTAVQTSKLQRELEEFQAEAKAIRNQELTIRKLEERNKALEAELAAKEHQLRESQEANAHRADEEASTDLREREQRLVAALADAQSSLAAVSRKHQDAQDKLLELQQRKEDSAAGAEADADLANEELDRAKMQLVALEQEKRQLQEQLHDPATSGRVPLAQAQSMRDDLTRAARENQRLVEELEQAQQHSTDAEEAAAARVAGLQRSLAAAEEARVAQASELAARPTVQAMDELRREVQALQALQFGSVDVVAAEEGGAGGSAVLEKAAAARVRSLEHQITSQRLQLSESAAAVEAAEAKAAQLEGSLAEARQTIAGLEEDLLATDQAGQGDASAAQGGEVADHSMLQALCSQRDRFRSKAQELQEALSAAHALKATAEAEAAAARADNVALVERLKYVSSYSQSSRRAQTLSAAEAGQKVEEKYLQEYEQRLDPFSEFKGKVKEGRQRQMPIADKLVYIFGHVLFGSRFARLAIVVYVMLMHVFTFLVLFSVTHSRDGISARDWHCSRSAAGQAIAAAQAPEISLP